MPKKILQISVITGGTIAAVVLVAGGLVFAQIIRNRSASQLPDLIDKTLKENKQLQVQLADAEKKIAQLESLLQRKELEMKNSASPQMIKEALAGAQATIAQLNREVEQARSDKEVYEQRSMALASRTQSLTQELTRSLDELRNTRQEFEALKRGKYDQIANQDLIARDDLIKSLQAEVARLSSSRSPQKTSLNIPQKQSGLPIERSKELERLREELASREDELIKVKQELRNQLAKVTAQPASAQFDEIKRLYDSAKTQVLQLSEILTTKEIELNAHKKDSVSLKDQVSSLQKKIASLEGQVKSSQNENVKLKSLESERLSYELKYNQAQKDIRQQNELIASLSSALETLNKKIDQKEEEKKVLEAQISQTRFAKVSSEEELERQKKRVDDLDNFYGGLKDQIVNFSQFLNEKESELSQKYKEIAGLQDELTIQQSKITNLESELADTRERQRKMLENLSEAKNLSSGVQEALINADQSVAELPPEENEVASFDKKKAEELKRKIEVILTPQVTGN